MDDEEGWFFREKVLRPGEGHDWMAHDHAVVTLVMSGRLDECLAHEVQSCGSLELHYKPRGLRHVTSTGPEGVRMLLLCMRGSSLWRLQTRDDRPRLLTGGVRAAHALAEFVAIAAWQRRPCGPPPRAVRNLLELLKDESSHDGRRRPVWITEVRERIVTEGSDRHGLEELADEFHVQPVYLARAFRAHYGLTIGALRRRSRIDRAVARLRDESATLATLASELGYSDQSHFTRAFRRETGWTPAAFRAAVLSLRLSDV